MSDDLVTELEKDFGDMEALLRTLIAAEAMTPRGEEGPLARPWAKGGTRSRIRRAMFERIVGKDRRGG